MKKIISVLLTAVLLLPFAVNTVPAEALEETVVQIGVQGGFDNLDIRSLTKHTDMADWAFTMMYDRLLYVDSDGTLKADLAKSFEVVLGDVENPPEPEEVLLPIWPGRDPYEQDTDSSWDDDAVNGYDFNPGNVNAGDLGPSSWNYVTVYHDKYFSHINFELREDLRFSDGSYLTADSIKDMVDQAKTLSTDSIARRQWQAVTIQVIEDYKFRMDVDFGGQPYGLTDFLYSLASPSGSIFMVEESQDCAPIGSGMFVLADFVERQSATFERNSNWEAENSPVYAKYGSSGTGNLAQRIVFKNMIDPSRIASYIENEILQVGIVQGQEPSVDEYYHEISIVQVAGNPIALTFNPSLKEETPYANFIREIIVHGFDKNKDEEISLLESSSDHWAIGTWGKEERKYLIELGRGELGMFYDDETLPDVYLTLIHPQGRVYSEIAGKIKYGLSGWNIYVDIFEMDATNYEAALQSGNYDLALTEIDLMDINSAHKTFYGKGNDDMDRYLNFAKNALSVELYGKMHIAVQAECKNSVALFNLGWEQNNVLLGYRVSGLTKPSGYCPTGDISRLDFRWIRRDE